MTSSPERISHRSAVIVWADLAATGVDAASLTEDDLQVSLTTDVATRSWRAATVYVAPSVGLLIGPTTDVGDLETGRWHLHVRAVAAPEDVDLYSGLIEII